MVIHLGLARRTARQIESASLFYLDHLAPDHRHHLADEALHLHDLLERAVRLFCDVRAHQRAVAVDGLRQRLAVGERLSALALAVDDVKRLVKQRWGLEDPAMLVNVDAGSTHPLAIVSSELLDAVEDNFRVWLRKCKSHLESSRTPLKSKGYVHATATPTSARAAS